jgi:two-component system CheB/CheR fusion protein
VVTVTGICLFEPGDLKTGERWRTKSFQLLLRSPADVVLVKAPPWWTLRKLLWTVGLLVVVSLLALAWVVVLRRRVQEQTGVIRQQLQVEASLKERYRDLFENANDMVFTHDLTGRLTSMNRSGERLLQRGRRRLFEMRLMDLVAQDQRPEVEHWLNQLVKGAELPSAEWDFLSASGKRVKMELSSRLIEQPQREPEVEVIARDITERRRLEHELLEVSNNEQRRIGHDLHDGVCQQLVGIACRVQILGEQLQELGSPLAAVAETIGALINEATIQARGVARGLFPVRLEESGLVAAIEELAASASERSRIQCEFACASPPSAVDNEVALHLYYIAQESLLNAVKHGQASRVTVTLAPEGERFRLAVRDDGVGFQPARRSHAGMGIRIMRHRAKVIGATLDVLSQQGRGTEVACLFFPTRKPKDSVDAAAHG